jgi:hypothetical protein
LGFAARELRVTPNGVQSGSARLGLSDDVEARLGAATLRFKGSSSSEGGSYVEWGCSGFQRAVVTLEQDLPRSWLVPVDQGGNATSGPVRITYQSILDPRTPGLIPTGGMPRSMFAFAPGFILEPVAVSLDLSTSRNPQGIAFPADYQGVRDDGWMGLFVPSVTLNLPPAIKSFGSAAPVQTDLRGLLIDAGGVNVSAGLNNLLSLSQGDLGGWGFSVDRFELNVVNSSLVNGQLLGKVQIPIGETALDYTATISVPDEQDPQAEDQAPPPPPGAAAGTMNLAAKAMALAEEQPDTTTGLKYSFRIQPPSGGIDATLFGSARMQLDPSSRISVTVAKVRGETQFKPVAELNGSLTITRDVDLAGIRFQGFKLMSEEPYVSKGTWSFASPQHYIGAGPNAHPESTEPGAPPPPPSARGLPITIENIEAMGRLDQGNVRIGIAFDAGVNIPGAKALFSADTRIEVWGIIERGSDGRSRPRFDRVDLNRICASGGAPGAFEIGDGSCLDFYRDDRTFGNGVAGSINATFVKSLNVESTARFGTTNAGLEYFYIDGSAIFNQGVRIPVIEVVSWYGFNGGVYYHMDKGARGFVPNGSVALGLRAGVTFGASQPSAATINGNLTLDGSFGQNYSLRQLRLEGLGCMMSPILDRCRGAPTTAQMELTYVVSRNEVTGNFRMDIDNGAVRGGGQARLFAGRSKFLLHVGVGGTQDRPRIDNGSKFRVTLAGMANVRGYLAAGTAGTLPPFPNPPSGAPQPNRSGVASTVASGAGIMFGVSADLDFRADYGLISASARGAAGFDVALRDLSNRTCRGQVPGLDGWYGRGQLYAYLVATGSIRVLDVISWFQDVAKVVYYYVTEWFNDAGCEIACWFGSCDCKRSRQARRSRTEIQREYRVQEKWNTYNLATLYVGALLEAGFPNPTWFTGTLQMKYTGLGGVRVNVNVPFTQGSVCRI